MAEPWFADPNAFGALYGAIAGGVGGTLVGGLGAAIGYLAPRGKGRPWVLGAMVVFLVLGAAQLIVGVVAVASGQPYGIWYPLVLCGVVMTVVVGGMLPVVRRVYAQAEGLRDGPSSGA